MTLPDRLRETRKLAKIAASELSRLAGLSDGYVNHLESGRRQNPGLTPLQKIAGVLGTTATYLIDGVGEPPTAEQVTAAVEAARKGQASQADDGEPTRAGEDDAA